MCDKCRYLQAKLAQVERERDKLASVQVENKRLREEVEESNNVLMQNCNRGQELKAQLTAAQEENKRLEEQNADLLAALQIVKEQRQLWWGKAVHRGRELYLAQQSAQDWASRCGELQSRLERTVDKCAQSAQEQRKESMEWALCWVKANWSSDWGKTICGMEDAIRTELSKGEGK